MHISRQRGLGGGFFTRFSLYLYKNLITMEIRSILIYSAMLCQLSISLPATAQKILASSTTRHAFSSRVTKDVFKLTLTGKTLLESNATFDIINFKGVRIYHETFDGSLLLNELEVDAYNLNLKQQEDYIRKRVKEFFHEKNFLKPAIKLMDMTDNDYSDMDIWNGIRINRKAIGFSYLLSYENNRKIAWSENLKRTVVYWACC